MKLDRLRLVQSRIMVRKKNHFPLSHKRVFLSNPLSSESGILSDHMMSKMQRANTSSAFWNHYPIYFVPCTSYFIVS